jgi:hypothetical protein
MYSPGRGLFEFERVRALASRYGGRGALEHLEDIDDTDGSKVFAKGIHCLQAYRDRIRKLSENEAKKVIMADDAGRRVHAWVIQPHVWREIKQPCGEQVIHSE